MPTERNRTMKSILCTIIFVIAVSIGFAQTKSGEGTPQNSVEQEIINLERERLKAFADADKAAFERVVADDVTITHGYREGLTKRQEIAVMTPSMPERPSRVHATEDPMV